MLTAVQAPNQVSTRPWWRGRVGMAALALLAVAAAVALVRYWCTVYN